MNVLHDLVSFDGLVASPTCSSPQFHDTEFPAVS